jgi:hypothetical protein
MRLFALTAACDHHSTTARHDLDLAEIRATVRKIVNNNWGRVCLLALTLYAGKGQLDRVQILSLLRPTRHAGIARRAAA